MTLNDIVEKIAPDMLECQRFFGTGSVTGEQRVSFTGALEGAGVEILQLPELIYTHLEIRSFFEKMRSVGFEGSVAIHLGRYAARRAAIQKVPVDARGQLWDLIESDFYSMSGSVMMIPFMKTEVSEEDVNTKKNSFKSAFPNQAGQFMQAYEAGLKDVYISTAAALYFAETNRGILRHYTDVLESERAIARDLSIALKENSPPA